MRSFVKKLAAPMLGVIAIFNIYAQDADDFISPYEIEQGQYEGAELYEDGKFEEAFSLSSIAAQRGMKTGHGLVDSAHYISKQNTWIFGICVASEFQLIGADLHLSCILSHSYNS
jgi:hypothetical protein